MKFKYISLLICLSLLSGCNKENENQVVETEKETEVVNTVETETTTEETELETEFIEETGPVISEVTGIELAEALDVTMYAVEPFEIREGNGTEYDPISYLVRYETIHVSGRTSNDWYEIDCIIKDEAYKGYIPLKCLSLDDPLATIPEGMTEEEFQKKIELVKMMDEAEKDFWENYDGGYVSDIDTGDDESNWDNLPDDLSQVDW